MFGMFRFFGRKKDHSHESAGAEASASSAEFEQVLEVDTYGFPRNLIGHQLLSWMGSSYVEYVVRQLSAGLSKQDDGGILLGVKCQGTPEMRTIVNEHTGAVRSVTLSLALQVLIRSKDGVAWRLVGIALCKSSASESDAAQFEFELQRSEKVRG
jgi:hypothetical protein